MQDSECLYYTTNPQTYGRVHCKKVNFTAEAQRTQRKRGVIQEKISARLRAPRVSAVGLEAFFSRAMDSLTSEMEGFAMTREKRRRQRF
jgi:hypothetical protein